MFTKKCENFDISSQKNTGQVKFMLSPTFFYGNQVPGFPEIWTHAFNSLQSQKILAVARFPNQNKQRNNWCQNIQSVKQIWLNFWHQMGEKRF